MHLAIITNNLEVVKSLIRKGVDTSTQFNSKKFEYFAIWSFSLDTYSRKWTKKPKELADWKHEYELLPEPGISDLSPYPIIELWLTSMRWMQDDYNDVFQVRVGLKQDTYTPLELAIALQRRDMIGLFPPPRSIIINHVDWIKEALDNEERIVRYNAHRQSLVLSSTERKDILDYASSEKPMVRLRLLAEELKREILAGDNIFAMGEDISKWISRTREMMMDDVPRPKYQVLQKGIIVYTDKILGKGTEGVVLLGIYEGQRVAVKILFSSSSSKEVVLYERAYPELVKNREIQFLPEITYQDHPCSAIIMPCFEIGSLLQFMNWLRGKEMESITFELRLQMVLNIASRLKQLHDNKVAHRDIKSSNVLLQPSLFPVFIDFGFSEVVSHDTTTMPSFCGTAEYIAPEIWSSTVYDLYKADVYSFGILMWEILTCKVPYSDGDEIVDDLQVQIELNDTEAMIEEKVLTRREGEALLSTLVLTGTRPTCNKTWPKWLIELHKNCWNENPSKRPTMKEVTRMIEEKF